MNNQIVVGTLMALCDDPSFVSLGDSWTVAGKTRNRIPIIVTGNDLRQVPYRPCLPSRSRPC